MVDKLAHGTRNTTLLPIKLNDFYVDIENDISTNNFHKYFHELKMVKLMLNNKLNNTATVIVNNNNNNNMIKKKKKKKTTMTTRTIIIIVKPKKIITTMMVRIDVIIIAILVNQIVDYYL